MSWTGQGQYPIPADYGQRVRFHRKPSHLTTELSGEGVFILAWMGIEEVWEVEVAGVGKIALHPCFGDTMEPIR